MRVAFMLVSVIAFVGAFLVYPEFHHYGGMLAGIGGASAIGAWKYPNL